MTWKNPYEGFLDFKNEFKKAMTADITLVEDSDFKLVVKLNGKTMDATFDTVTQQMRIKWLKDRD